jgi:hypothetical protein
MSNTLSSPETTVPAPNCEQMQNELGTPADLAMLIDPDFTPVFSEIADIQEEMHATRPEDLENGDAAKRASVALGCGTCLLAETCVVSENLDQKVTVGESNARFQSSVDMLTRAPGWLKQARNTKAGEETITSVIDKIEALSVQDDISLETYEEMDELFDKVLCGIKNKAEAVVSKNTLPELKTFNVFGSNLRFNSYKITVSEGEAEHEYSITDLSDRTKELVKPLCAKDRAVLLDKFVERLGHSDKEGQPLIYDDSDKTSLNIVRRFENADVIELKASNKRRMYFIRSRVTPNKILILGSHEPGEHNQQVFFDKVIKPGN